MTAPIIIAIGGPLEEEEESEGMVERVGGIEEVDVFSDGVTGTSVGPAVPVCVC